MFLEEFINIPLRIFQNNYDSLTLLLQCLVKYICRSIVHFGCLANDQRAVFSLDKVSAVSFYSMHVQRFCHFSGEIAVGCLNFANHVLRQR